MGIGPIHLTKAIQLGQKVGRDVGLKLSKKLGLEMRFPKFWNCFVFVSEESQKVFHYEQTENQSSKPP